MSFKSKAQKEKLQQLVKEGKMAQSTFDEFEKASEGKQLPERVSKPPRYKSLEELRKASKRYK